MHCIGLGEANIMVCGGFLTVEHMRQGMSPTDAALATLKRVVALTPPSLLDERGRQRPGCAGLPESCLDTPMQRHKYEANSLLTGTAFCARIQAVENNYSRWSSGRYCSGLEAPCARISDGESVSRPKA